MESLQKQISQPTPNTLTEQRFGDDAGAINPSLIAERTVELAKESAVIGQVVYYGLRAAIANKRGEWADNRTQKMEHKQQLYTELGARAMTGNPSESPTVRPRTIAERFMDKRLEKRNWELQMAESRRKQVISSFGGQRNLPGSSRAARSDAKSSYRSGEITAQDLRSDLRLADMQRPLLETHAQKKSREKVTLSQSAMGRSANQPILSRWRGWRHNEATKDSARHNARSAKHTRTKRDIQLRRASR